MARDRDWKKRLASRCRARGCTRAWHGRGRGPPFRAGGDLPRSCARSALPRARGHDLRGLDLLDALLDVRAVRRTGRVAQVGLVEGQRLLVVSQLAVALRDVEQQ